MSYFGLTFLFILSFIPSTVPGLTQFHHRSWAAPFCINPSAHLGSSPAPPESHSKTGKSTGSRSGPSRWPDVCLWSGCTSLANIRKHRSVANERGSPNGEDGIGTFILQPRSGFCWVALLNASDVTRSRLSIYVFLSIIKAGNLHVAHKV